MLGLSMLRFQTTFFLLRRWFVFLNILRRSDVFGNFRLLNKDFHLHWNDGIFFIVD